MKAIVPTLAIALCLAGSHPAAAAIPQTMSYQGLLLGAGGSPVADGAYELTFRIYDVASGPDAALWTESHAAVPVSRGVFHVILGAAGTPLTLAFDAQYYLGVTIGAGEELTPRVQLASSPYSLNALNVVDGAITAPKIAAGQVVKSLNGLRDDVTLAPGSNISITPAGQTLTIAATGAGLTLPFSSSTASAGTLFDLINTDGGSAGSFKISDAGSGAAALYASTAGAGLALLADGRFQVGSVTTNGELNLFATTAAQRTLTAHDDAGDGAQILGYDAADNITFNIESDGSGFGGRLALAKDDVFPAFIVDGNFMGTQDCRVDIVGDDVGATFDMSQTGDDSVILPDNSLAGLEILDEPGVASATEGIATIALTGGVDVLQSRSLTVPAAGYVLVIGTLQANVAHTTGTASDCTFGVSDDAAGFPVNQDILITVPAVAPTATYRYAVTVHGLFSVASSGTFTFYLPADESTGAWSANDTQLSLVYFGTNYGTVEPTLAEMGAPAVDEQGAPTRAARSATEIATEQSGARALHLARVQREMSAMGARLDALQRTLRMAESSEGR